MSRTDALRIRTGADGIEHVPDMDTWERGWAKGLCGSYGGHVDCYRLAGLPTPDNRPQCQACIDATPTP